MKKHISCLAAILILASANYTYAHSPEYSLDEIIVTAAKIKLNPKELPQSVEIITQEEIKAIGATNLKDVLRLSPSIFVTEAAGAASVVKMRGSSDYVILLNGHRLIDNVSLMQDDYRWEHFNIQNIERVEILRGPSSALYGSNAEAGVINIVTKHPSKQSFVVGVTNTSREASNYYRFDTGETDKLSASFDANFTKIKPFLWEDAGSTKREGPKQSFNLNTKYKFDELNSLALFLEYENADLTYRLTKGPVGEKIILPKRFNSDTERKTAILSYSGGSDRNSYTIDTTYTNLQTDRKRDLLNIDLRNRLTANETFSVVYGAEYAKDAAQVDINHVLTDKNSEQWAGYVQGDLKVDEKLLLIPAFRYDHHSSFGGELSPSLGLTYFVAEGSRFKASYSEGYKAPTIEQLYKSWEATGSGGSHDFNLIGNPYLKPEESKGFEISYEHDFDNHTHSKISYYKRDKTDAIIMDLSHLRSDNYVKLFNVDKSTFKGTEFELTHDFNNGFNIGFNYEYLDAKRIIGGNKNKIKRLPYTAKNTYTLKAQWIEPKNQEWSVTVWNRWISDYLTTGGGGHTHNSNKPIAKSINTTNFVINKSWDNGKYSSFFGIDNVFNKKMIEMRYSGRVWRAGAELRF